MINEGLVKENISEDKKINHNEIRQQEEIVRLERILHEKEKEIGRLHQTITAGIPETSQGLRSNSPINVNHEISHNNTKEDVEQIKLFDLLQQSEDSLLDKQTEAEIATEVNRYSLCSTKRVVKYYRGLLVQFEDLVDVLGPHEAGAPYVTTQNVKEVNFSVDRARGMVTSMAEEVRHMLDKEIAASTSALNWKWKAETEFLASSGELRVANAATKRKSREGSEVEFIKYGSRG